MEDLRTEAEKARDIQAALALAAEVAALRETIDQAQRELTLKGDLLTDAMRSISREDWASLSDEERDFLYRNKPADLSVSEH
jgi:hypothetical protein